MIHASKIPLIMQRTDERGKPAKFSLKFFKLSTGEKVTADNVYMTSYWHRNGTLNLIFPSGETRKVRLALIVEFNGKEVFL